MGRFSGESPSAAPTILSSLIAGEAIKSGDVIVQGSDSLAYWATDPATVGAYSRPMYQAADAYLSQPSTVLNALGPAQGLYDTAGFAIITLDDGGYLTASYNGSNSFGFAIFNRDGSVRLPRQQVCTFAPMSSAYYPLAVRRLPNGNIVFFHLTDSAKPGITIVTQAGAIAKATTLLDTIGMMAGDAVVLTGGNIVVTYACTPPSTSGFTYRLQVLGQDGSVIKAAFTGGSTANGLIPRSLGVAAGTDGTFLMAWTSSAGGGFAQRYTAAGETSGAQLSLASSTASTQRIMPVALSNGAYAIGYCTDAANSGVSYLYMYGADLKLLRNTTLSNLVSNSATAYNPMDFVATSDGGVAAIYLASESNTTYIYAARWSATGVVMVAPQRLNPQPTLPSANNQAIRIYQNSDGSGGFFVTFAATFSSQVVGHVCHLDASMIMLRFVPVTNHPTLTAPMIFQGQDAVNSNVMTLTLFSGVNTTLYYSQLLFYTRGRLLVGVAMADAQPGDRVEFMISGSTPTRLTFIKNFTCDYNAQFGQKMAILGNMAVIKGIQQ